MLKTGTFVRDLGSGQETVNLEDTKGTILANKIWLSVVMISCCAI